MQILTLNPGSWGANCYILISGSHAAVVDPSPAAETVLNVLKQNGAALEMILLTHGHFDHVTSMQELRQLTNAPIYAHQNDMDMPADAHKNAFYRVFGMKRDFGTANKPLRDGDTLLLGEETIEVIHTPGHTAGCVCYLTDKLLLTGDTLFDGARGRTDLYSSDEKALYASIDRLRMLSPELTIYPGHGNAATLGAALRHLEADRY